MNELFDLQSVTLKSPRLVWLERYGVKTFKSPHVPDDEEPWNCWVGDIQAAMRADAVDHGATEDEAIVNWAKRVGVKLWNEE